MRDFEVVQFGCPFCYKKIFSILMYNTNTKLENWIDIIGINSADPRLKVFGDETVPVPTGILLDGHLLENFLRDSEHTLWFLKSLKG